MTKKEKMAAELAAKAAAQVPQVEGTPEAQGPVEAPKKKRITADRTVYATKELAESAPKGEGAERKLYTITSPGGDTVLFTFALAAYEAEANVLRHLGWESSTAGDRKPRDPMKGVGGLVDSAKSEQDKEALRTQLQALLAKLAA